MTEGSQAPSKRLAVYTLGFLRDQRLQHILELSGWDIAAGMRPSQFDAVGIWGRKPVAKRGLYIARRFDLPVLNIEDAFLRSIEPGHTGSATIGLLLDRKGLHYDSAQPSELEDMLQSGELSDPELLQRAQTGIETLQNLQLSKYNAWRPAPLPDPGYVLVIDQTRGDASIKHGGASSETFANMLTAARADHPGKRIIIRTHPEVADEYKSGHYGDIDRDAHTSLMRDPTNPWDILKRATAVYCVTSQMGFEAILAGHKPVVFGQPFYAGWGLTTDISPVTRRTTKRSVVELFAAAMLLYPIWYDPCRDRLCSFEDAVSQLDAERRAWAENDIGAVCTGLKPWKHAPMTAFLKTREKRPLFENTPENAVETARDKNRELVVWAGKVTDKLVEICARNNVPLRQMEDGFLRSVGLGAQLLPAASLVLDDLGIYFDPTGPSRLEVLIADGATLSPKDRDRAATLRTGLIAQGVTKYNVGADLPEIPEAPGKRKILVPGQVEDDASIRLGTKDVSTNLELLRRARAFFPDDLIIYKPHPDVEAGLRVGVIHQNDLDELADVVARDAPAAALMDRVDVVWTMTSLMGFEALIRQCEVHCLGRPFYAGWGLTHDHGQDFPRRNARPELDALVHATLIDYPRYFDPVSGRACPAEVVLERLAARGPEVSSNPARRMRWLAALQYRLRRYAHLWR